MLHLSNLKVQRYVYYVLALKKIFMIGHRKKGNQEVLRNYKKIKSTTFDFERIAQFFADTGVIGVGGHPSSSHLQFSKPPGEEL